MNTIYHRLLEESLTMALYEYHTKEYREDLFSLYEHAKRVSNHNEIPVEMVFEDLIIHNLMDY